MVTVGDAIDLILSHTKTVDGFEQVFVTDALGRIAYEDIVSGINVPHFLRSAMDGYGLVGECGKYKVVERDKDLEDCTCIRINTGFPIPDKVFAVAEVEIIKIENGFLRLLKPVEKGRNFTVVGVEVKEGGIIAQKGERISVRKRALLAYCGVSSLKVRRKPLVGIITTGDEVVFPNEELGRFGVYNANYFILDGLIRKWFSEPVYFGHVKDDVNSIAEIVAYAVERCDVLITTGGVSAGSKDFMKGVLESNLSAKIIFDKTTIKPGKPAVFAKMGDKILFGMPGWPSALYATAYIYLKPMLYKLSGFDHKEFELTAKLSEPMRSRAGKFYFNRVKLDFKHDTFYAVSAGSQKTDNFYSTAVADGLLGIEEKKGSVEAGQQLPLILFDD